MPRTPFDPDLIELTLTLPTMDVLQIYKVGGGTLGRSYIGYWGYRLMRNGTPIAAGEDLHTGTPKTHREAAELARLIISAKEN